MRTIEARMWRIRYVGVCKFVFVYKAIELIQVSVVYELNLAILNNNNWMLQPIKYVLIRLFAFNLFKDSINEVCVDFICDVQMEHEAGDSYWHKNNFTGKKNARVFYYLFEP